MQHGRFITTAIAAVAAMAIGPAGAVAAPSSFTDDDFAGGAATAPAAVSAGSVQLTRSLVTESFDGATLPAGLAFTAWPMQAGSASLSSGTLVIEGGHVDSTRAFSPAQGVQVLQFDALFAGESNEHVGFGDVANGPFVIFSTGNTGGTLLARTLAPGGTETGPNTPTPVSGTIPGFDATLLHTYRIEWSATDAKFYVDGTLVATHPVAIPSQPVVMSDATANTASLRMQSLSRMLYPSPGVFESRTFDAGNATAVWSAVTPTAVTPAGTTVAIATRTGQTPTPDASWSSYQPLSGGAVQSPAGRYIQYQATLATTDDQVTPSLDKVQLDYDVPAAAGGTQSGGSTATGSGSGGTQGGGSSALDTTAPKVSLAAKSLRASKSGTVSFRVKCPATETSCKITLKLKNGGKSAASKTVTVKGGKTVTLTLKLSNATRALLKHGSLKVSAVMTATDAAGNRKTTTRKLTLRRPA
jgi:hypothetical protein